LATNAAVYGIGWNPFNSNFYVVARNGTNGFIQRYTASGGNPGGVGPVTFGNATFSGGQHPQYITFDSSGNVYIGDQSTSVIFPFTATGTPGSTFGSFSLVDGLAYDSVNNKLMVLLLTFPGKVVKCNTDGSAPVTATVDIPTGAFAADSSANVFVGVNASSGNLISKYNSAISPLASFGPYGSGPGQLQRVECMTTDSKGYVYVSDSINNTLVEYAPY
jgi:hypothetical protein